MNAASIAVGASALLASSCIGAAIAARVPDEPENAERWILFIPDACLVGIAGIALLPHARFTFVAAILAWIFARLLSFRTRPARVRARAATSKRPRIDLRDIYAPASGILLGFAPTSAAFSLALCLNFALCATYPSIRTALARTAIQPLAAATIAITTAALATTP